MMTRATLQDNGSFWAAKCCSRWPLCRPYWPRHILWAGTALPTRAGRSHQLARASDIDNAADHAARSGRSAT